jgi:hypothetical protein
MAPKTARKPKSTNDRPSRAQPANNVSTPAAALLSFLNLFSFLKETRGMTSWTARDLAKSLKISPTAAKQALAILEMQGYVKSTGLACRSSFKMSPSLPR